MSASQQQMRRRRSSACSVNEDGTAAGERPQRDDDEQSIIDVFEFDDTADDRWLCSIGGSSSSRRNSVEHRVEDLEAWLHADVGELDATSSDCSSRRSIDTRTFTRIKRKSNRLSFENIEASVSPETMPYSLSNVWKNQSIPESPTQIFNNNNDKEYSIFKDRRDSVPMMLRPKTNQVLAALLSESPSSISSQTSMEAFMNAGRSKEGLNSLLSDMSDPDLSHLLMNISQPSLLYSSIISDGKGDESVHPVGLESLVDSQILTDSMMEASMFKEVQDTNMIAAFLKQNNDCTVLEDKTFCKSFDADDKTFVTDQLGDKTYLNIDNDRTSPNGTFVSNGNSKKNNETYLSFPSPVNKLGVEANSTKIILPQENLLNTTQVIIKTPSPLNSTKTIAYNHGTPTMFQNKDILSSTQTLSNEKKTDLTFELKSESPSPNGERLDATFQTSNFTSNQIPRLSSAGSVGNSLDATYDAVPNLRAELLQEVQRSSGNKFDSTFISGPTLPNIESKLDVTYERPSTAEPLDAEAEVLDATYIQVPSLQQPESQNIKKGLDVTYDTAQLNSKLGNPASTRRLSYILKKNSTESQAPALDPNRFNTFRKDSKIGSRLSKMPQPHDNVLNNKPGGVVMPLQQQVPNAKSTDNLYQQRFSTFSKKTAMNRNMPAERDIDEDQADNNKPALTKPAPKQIQAPRQLSKLPHLFQKSNPNLGSSLKPLSKTASGSDAGLSKGFQPNMYALGRFKSEQRLQQVKNATEFAMVDGTSRSTESIESTASAHSAPDLDDRLSICSDSSRASYTIKPRNIEALKKMASMEERGGKIGRSTPNIKGRQILENTWVEEKDLPSPIFKNGGGRAYAESVDSRSTSPSESADFNAKTSSPLTISPASSDQAINAIGNDDGGLEAAKENIQVTDNVRPKQLKVPNSISGAPNATKLRRPSNWAGATNKLGNGTGSGIPRPASRIPAPRFARPSLK